MRKLTSILFQSFAKKKSKKLRSAGDVKFSFIKSIEHIHYLPYTINATNIPYEAINNMSLIKCH